MKILVSLVNYNSRDYILACLAAIYNQKVSSKYSFEVVVFDNNSPDKSAKEIKKAFPKIELIEHNENLGFGKAHNLVAKKIDAFDGMLLVNPDTTFGEDTFQQLFSFFEEHQRAGIVSGKILKKDGSLDSNGGNFPTGISLLSWLFNLESFGVKTNFHRSDVDYYAKVREVDWVGGTFMLIRKEVIKKTGLFDPEYFMYFEDVDFCIRARKAGFSIMIDPEVSVTHISGASSDNPRYFQWLNEYRNLLLFYKNNIGLLSSVLVRILVYISIGLRMLAFGLLGRFGTVGTYWKVFLNI